MAITKATAGSPERTRREPFRFFRDMTSEFDRVFDEPFFASFWPSRAFDARATSWSPAIDVFEKDHVLVTRIDLPGMAKDDVKVEVTDGYLTIAGERKSEKEEKKDNEYRSERAYGSFYRAVPLPDGARFEDVRATFADGVLEVIVPLPTKAETAPRRVEVKGAPAARAA